MGGLHSQQLVVYEGFQRQRALAAAQQAQAAQQGGMGGGGGGVSGGQPSVAAGQGLGPATGAAGAPPSLTMSQVTDTPQQPTKSTHPINTPINAYQHTPTTHPINTHSQHPPNNMSSPHSF